MGIFELLILAFALAMDAFAVSVCLGLKVSCPKIKHYLLPSLYFGFFQALMPAIGYFAGSAFANLIQNYANFLSFIILTLIGVNMVKESFENPDKCDIQGGFSHKTLLLLAIATSIDALAAGFTFAFLKMNLLKTVMVIGIVTFLTSAIGVKTGAIFGTKYKQKAEITGGIVLILIGVKVLLKL